MVERERGYKGERDLLNIGQLLRETYRSDPSWNAWSFARFDIWAQRRLGDEKVFGRSEWHGNLRLWEGADGRLSAAALVDCDQGVVPIGRPDRPDLLPGMLAWAVPRFESICPPGASFQVEALEGNPALIEVLENLGYRRSKDYMTRRLRVFGSERDAVHLPQGYRIKHLETDPEIHAFHEAVEAVFNFRDCLKVYELLRQAPSAIPDLGLILWNEVGEVTSFCSIWADKENNIAEFEPVGTMPQHRTRGLAALLIREGSNRLRDLGISRAMVDSWSESPAANRLYQSAGFEPIEQMYGWGRRS